MLQELFRLLQKAPEYSDPESTAIARLIQYAAVGMLGIGLLFALENFFLAARLSQRAALFVVSVAIITFLILFLLKRQYLIGAGITLVVFLWLIITVGVITAGGSTTPVFAGYLIVILAGSLLIPNKKISNFISLICLFTGILIATTEQLGWLSAPKNYSTLERLSAYSLFFILVIIFQHINTNNLQALGRQISYGEQRYRTFLENIPITTYINSIDENARTEYVSPQVEILLGYPRESFLADPELWKKILHPDDQTRVFALNADTVLPGEAFNMEYRLITKDGRTIWVKDEANLVKDEQGHPQYWLGVWTDITIRKQVEEEQADLIGTMTKRNIQLQTAAEVSRAASSILDLNSLLPTVVNLICNHFDYYYVGIFLIDAAQEWAILSAATGDAGKEMLQAGHRLKITEPSMISWCISNKKARIALDVGVDAVRFKNPLLPLTRSEIAFPLLAHGEMIGAMSIQSNQPAAFSQLDITTLQTMADQISNVIANARLFTERSKLIEELEARNAELEQFSYTVSHDLRSPLVTIRGFLGYLRQDAVSGDMNHFDKDLNRIANAVDKMRNLLNDLLELSRIGRVINPSEEVPFENLIAEALEILHGTWEGTKIKFVMSDSFPRVFVDRARVIEVLQNLISNAIKFMGKQDQPVVEIGTLGPDKDRRQIFFVRDNGMGIEAQYHNRIFGLFNRLDPTIEGTGIGLTLVKRIIETQGGRIWLQSYAGAGSTFFFTLPTH
jgi:PAS domain S-box-containing protein